jgi:cyclopropane fatty-acyl-phospholipid synthase-like methyltransferase
LTGSKLLQNMLRGRRGAVQRHYDIGTDLFEAFLDPTMTYTCGMRVADDMAGRRARHELRTDVGLSSMESSGALARHRSAESRR